MSQSSRQTDLNGAGRALIQALYAASKLVFLYGGESQVACESVESLVQTFRHARDTKGETRIRVESGTVFLNGQRLRMEMDGMMAFKYVQELLDQRQIGEMRFMAGAEVGDVVALLTAIRAGDPRETDDPFTRVADHLALGGSVRCEVVRVRGLSEVREEQKVGDIRESSVEMYLKACFVGSRLHRALEAGQDAGTRKAKRVVQSLVDVLTRAEPYLLGLVNFKCLGDYHGCHATNVAILSMAIGRRLGLHKRRLAVLGLSAFLHDMGRTTHLDPTGAADAHHCATGGRRLLGAMGFSDSALRCVLAARGHHAPAVDSTGLPAPLDHRIIAIVDAYDTLTTAVSGELPALGSTEVLEAMASDPARYDPRLVRLLGAIVGPFPVGSFVRLDDGTEAVVVGRSRDPEVPSRPVVRLAAPVDDAAAELDLADRDAESGRFLRSIAAVMAPNEAWETPAAMVAAL